MTLRMNMRPRGGLVAVVLLAIGLTASCSSGSTDGASGGSSASAPGSSGTTAAVWDPRALPESAAKEMGLDTTFPPQCSPIPGAPEIKSCGWTSYPPGGEFPYNGIVFSVPWSLDEFKAQTNLSDFAAAVVDGAPAVRFHVNNDSYANRCDVAYATSFGAIWANITVNSFEQRVNACQFVDKWAAIVKRNAPS